VIATVLLDLDDTLLPEQSAVDAALAATSERLRDRYGLDPQWLTRSVRTHARELWLSYDTVEYCQEVGIASWEGLAGDFSGDDSTLCALLKLAPSYRTDVWSTALADQGVSRPRLASELASAHVDEQPRHHVPFPETRAALEELSASYRLAILTNGAPAVQRGKISAAGLGSYFEDVFVSGDVGVGKPDAESYRVALRRLDVSADRLVMVGNSLANDVAGPQRAGLRAVWMNRTGASSGEVRPDGKIARLDELRSVIEAW